jgi:hypothetical protein
MGTTFLHLENTIAGHARGFDYVGGTGCGDQLEPHVHEFAGDLGNVRLVMVGDADEDAALRRQFLSGRQLGFSESFSKRIGDAHNLSGGLHLRSKHGVHAWKFIPGKDRRLHVIRRSCVEVFFVLNIFRQKLAQLASGHKARGDLSHRNACGFRDIGYRTRSSRVDFEDIHFSAVVFCKTAARDRELNIHKPNDF